MYVPRQYEQINLEEGLYRPSEVKNRNNLSFAFWERALFQRIQSVLEINGFPSEWNVQAQNFYYWILLRQGYVCHWKSNEFGNVFDFGSLSGYDYFRQPTTCIVANPKLKHSKELKIGRDCELAILTTDYSGLWDIVDYYAEKLSLLDNAINVSLINAKNPKILAGKTRAVVQALKKMMDKINGGTPTVYMDGRLEDTATDGSTPFQFLDLNVNRETYLTPLQLQDFQTILNAFDREVGIANVPYQKKERMTQFESESTQTESLTRISLWIRTLNESFKSVNEMFELNLHARINIPNQNKSEEVEVNE